MPKLPCIYHPEVESVGFCERCKMPVCAVCLTYRMNYITRSELKLCNICIAKSDAKTMSIIIGTFLPFIFISSLAWLFFIISPFLGWLYILSVPIVFGALAFRYYKRKMKEIEMKSGQTNLN